MEGDRTSSLRLKRKPLSDCTNTRHNNRPNKLISQTLIKPPKNPSVFTPIVDSSNQKKNQNPNSNSSKNVLVSSSSVKSHTGTGSNKSPNSDVVSLQSLNPLSRAGDISRPFATHTPRQDEQTRKDKGKSVVATPIVQPSAYLTSRAIHISSPAVSGYADHVSRPPQVENQKVDEQKRKDKGKMVVETPIIHISTPLTSHTLQTSSSAASGNWYLPVPSAAHSHKQDAQAKKDNRKIGQETPNIEESGPKRPRSPTISSSAASGTDDQGKTSVIVYNQRRALQRKMLGVGSISLPFSCPPDKRTKKKGVELDDGGGDSHAGSHTDPLPLHKKKRPRNKKDDSMHAMPLDEVAKLKAYYADIDAFELPEEVASESELE